MLNLKLKHRENFTTISILKKSCNVINCLILFDFEAACYKNCQEQRGLHIRFNYDFSEIKKVYKKVVNLTAAVRLLAEASYQKEAVNVNLYQFSVSDTFPECIETIYNEFCLYWLSSITNPEAKNMK